MTLSDPGPKVSYRQSILLSYISTLFFWGAVYIYMPILSPYAQMISGSLQAVGLVMGAYGLSQLLLRIPLGMWSDRWRRRKPFILLGFIFDGLAALGLLLSPNTIMLFFSVLAAGIAASMWVPFTVLFASYFPLGEITRSMSLILFFNRLALITSNYAGGVVAEIWGWTGPFYGGMILSFIGFLLASGLAERRPEKSSIVSWQELLLMGRNRSLLLPSLFCTLLQFTIFSAPVGFTLIHAQQVGASKGQLGLLLSSYQLTSTLATLLAGIFLRRFLSERWLIFGGFLLVAWAMILTPCTGNVRSLYGVQALNGIGVGLVFPLLMGLAMETIPFEQRATAMGFFQSLYAVGTSAGPVISGLFAQYLGLDAVFILNGMVAFAAGVLSFKKIRSTS